MQIPVQVALKCFMLNKLKKGADAVGPGTVPITGGVGDTKTKK